MRGRIPLVPVVKRIFLKWHWRVRDLLRYSGSGARNTELRLCASLALGERRVVSVIACGSRRFLVGSTASSLSLLAELPLDLRSLDSAPTWKFVGGELRPSNNLIEPDAL